MLPAGGVEGVVPVPLELVGLGFVGAGLDGPEPDEVELDDPVLEEPVLDEPVLEDPVLEEPVLEELDPVEVEPVELVPVVPVLVPVDLVVPVLEEPVLEEPVLEEPVLEEPVLGVLLPDPVVVLPVLDEPVLELVLELPLDGVEVPVETVGAAGVVAVGAAPWPSVRLSSTLICESTLMLSAREPALIIRAFTFDVLNVALTPSTVATIELPLFVRATVMVLVSPVVPVHVRTPPIMLGVTVNMSRDSSASNPLKGEAGLYERRRRFFDVWSSAVSVEICFDAETRKPRVRFTRAIILPLPEKSELETRE